MNEDPLHVYETWRIRGEDCERGALVRNDLQAIVDRMGQADGAEVKLRGSCLCGVGVRDADVDVTLITHSYRPTLDSVAREIPHSGKFQLIANVSGAQVPILVLRHSPTGRQVDLSYNGASSVAMAHVLRALADLNPLLEPMIVYLKVWAKKEGLIDPRNNYFSGFVFTLMAIFHQQRRAGMAAIALSSGDWSEAEIRRLAATKRALGVEVTSANLRAQLRDFFDFYANYNYRQLIDIRTGLEGSRPYSWSRHSMAIAHPVESNSSYNCGAFIRGPQLEQARQAFRRAVQRV